MSLNIKNETVHGLAREAARRSGLTQTGAIQLALEEFLARDRIDMDSRMRRVDVIVADFDHRLDSAARKRLSTDLLYDDVGLPR